MLLNEFLKAHRTIQELKSTVAKQEDTIEQQASEFKSTIAQQEKQIEALTAIMQRVSEKIELNETTPQLVADRR